MSIFVAMGSIKDVYVIIFLNWNSTLDLSRSQAGVVDRMDTFLNKQTRARVARSQSEMNSSLKPRRLSSFTLKNEFKKRSMSSPPTSTGGFSRVQFGAGESIFIKGCSPRSCRPTSSFAISKNRSSFQVMLFYVMDSEGGTCTMFLRIPCKGSPIF